MGSRVLSSSFDWRKLRTRIPHRNDTAFAGSAPLASHVDLTLKLQREFAATQMCMKAPSCKWVSFSGCSRWGKEGRSSCVYTGLSLCKPGSCMCVKERTGQSGQHPKSGGWFPHWMCFQFFLHCNLNVEQGEVWKCQPLLLRCLKTHHAFWVTEQCLCYSPVMSMVLPRSLFNPQTTKP